MVRRCSGEGNLEEHRVGRENVYNDHQRRLATARKGQSSSTKSLLLPWSQPNISLPKLLNHIVGYS